MKKIDKLLDFRIDEERKELVVYQNNREVKRLGWQEFGEMQSNKLKIDMVDQIDYSVQDDEILMYADIGLWLHSGGPAQYQPNEEGVICFKVKYKDNGFVLEEMTNELVSDPEVKYFEKLRR